MKKLNRSFFPGTAKAIYKISHDSMRIMKWMEHSKRH